MGTDRGSHRRNGLVLIAKRRAWRIARIDSTPASGSMEIPPRHCAFGAARHRPGVGGVMAVKAPSRNKLSCRNLLFGWLLPPNRPHITKPLSVRRVVCHHTPVYTLLWVGGSGKNRGESRCTASRAWQTQPETLDLRSGLDSDSSDRKSSSPPGYSRRVAIASLTLKLSAFQSDSSDSVVVLSSRFSRLEIPVLVFHRQFTLPGFTRPSGTRALSIN